MLTVMGKPAEQTGWKFVLWNSPYRISPHKTHTHAGLIFPLPMYPQKRPFLITFWIYIWSYLNTIYENWLSYLNFTFWQLDKNPSKAAWLTVILIYRNLNLNVKQLKFSRIQLTLKLLLLFYFIVLNIIPCPFQITLQINIFEPNSKKIQVI